MSKNTIDLDTMCAMLAGAANAIEARHHHLSQLDAATGDGDHGVTMRRVAEAISAAVSTPGENMQMLLRKLAWAVMSVDGGATGPLLGSLFLGMSEAVDTESTLDCAVAAAMFESGLAKLQAQTKARVGDKTLMDALVPAVKAMHEAAQIDSSIDDALAKAAEAAARGAESTKTLRAAFGRARNLGDRTLGHADPGATSIAYLFAGLRVGLGDHGCQSCE